MKLHGYCTSCRRICLVQVNAAALARGGVPQGVCPQCEDEERQKARERLRGGTR